VTRILHVTECYAAGVGRAIDSAVRLTDNHEHHLLWTGEEQPRPGTLTSIERMPNGFFSRIAAYRNAVERIKPDVVHAHSGWAGVYTRLANLDTPVVYQPHCYKFSLPSLPGIARLAYWLGEAALSPRTSAVLLLSSQEEQLARRLNPSVPRHLVPSVATVTPDAALSPRWEGEERVVMSGRIYPQKDPNFFMAVARSVRILRPGTRFLWIGEGDARSRRRLRSAGIDVTGWLSGPEIAREMASPMVYFHSAQCEGFPLSVLDAAAFEHPVVVRSIPAFNDTTLLRAASVDETARLLVEILDYRPRRRDAIVGAQEVTAQMSDAHQKSALGALYSGYGEEARVPHR